MSGDGPGTASDLEVAGALDRAVDRALHRSEHDADGGGDAAPERRRPWSATWLALLTEAGPSAARRVQRGQALSRRGAVQQLQLEAGSIAATVAEDRSSPYRVELSWELAPPSAWDRAVTELRSELRYTAALLEGELPDGLADALEEEGIRLVPPLAALETSCSCPERSRICRHVAAVHTAAGVVIERDPVVLLRLGGRSRDELLREVRRGDDDAGAYVDEDIDLSRGLDAAHAELDTIELRPTPVSDPGSLLRNLGDPPGVDDPTPLILLVERAAAGAWRLAAGDGAEAADEELLLAELRAQRMASAASLADALGRDVEEVRTELDRLFAAGSIMRTGSDDRARYRAPSS